MASVELRPGQHYFGGILLSSMSHTDITVAEVEYPEAKKCRLHTHEQAFFALLLEGSYTEQFGHSTLHYQRFRLGFHPPAISHLDEVSALRTRFLIVQLSDTWMDRLVDRSRWTNAPPQLCNSHGSWLGTHLYHAVHSAESADLLVEGTVLEMMATLVPIGRDERRQPRWVHSVLDLLHNEFTDRLTLVEIARRLDLHPIYLSRQFRKWCGQSIGDFVHRLRVCYALEQLRQVELPLSEIALQAGFSDQSQFTKAFRRYQGMTPGSVRKAIVSTRERCQVARRN
jgi:AraC-like DNA-binding protein